MADFKDRAGAMEAAHVPVVSDDYPHAAAYEALFLLGTMRALDHPALKVEDYVTEQGHANSWTFAATHLLGGDQGPGRGA